MIEVYRSTVILASAQRTWALIRDFNAMPAWNATMKASRIENGPAERIGCLRVLTFDDGSVWTHALTGLSEPKMTIAYAIVGTPQPMKLPIRDYRASIRVRPVTDGDHAFVEWRAHFETDNEAAVRDRAGAVFQAGFEGLKRILASPSRA